MGFEFLAEIMRAAMPERGGGDEMGDELGDEIGLSRRERQARLRRRESRLAKKNRATREHDVAFIACDLENLKLVFLTEELVEVSVRSDVDLRTRQERWDTDIHLETTLHLLDDLTLDTCISLKRGLYVLPHSLLIRLLLREKNLTHIVLERYD